MKNLTGIIFALALLLAPSLHAQQRGVGLTSSAKQRVALVIGNSAYQTAPLKNPVNDAQDMAQTLRGLGFDVIYRENLNQNDMKRVIREFGVKIQNGGVGLFYYAGHGVQVKGVNYLVPVDAKVENEEEVEYECVDAGFVLAQMSYAKNSMNIVILDACRNNPFARSYRSTSRGLAMMGAPTGTLIAYSTEPGSVASDGNARNGIYTQELLKLIKTPNLDIENIFKRVRVSVLNLTQRKQTPWESSSLTGDFYFSGTDGEKAPNVPSPNAPFDPAAVELAYWETIKNSSDPEDFREYLDKYPKGQFASLARRRAQSTSSRLPNRDEGSGAGSSPNRRFGIRTATCSCRGEMSGIALPSFIMISYDGGDADSDIKVTVNGKDVSALINNQNQHVLSVSGSLKDLNVRDGRNEVVISQNGIVSDPFVFRQTIDNPRPSSPSPAVDRSVRITGVSCMCEQFVTLKVPNSLLILGSGWEGGSDVKVLSNGQDISAHIDSQDALISLKGSIKELNIRDGRNEIVIIVNGVTSNTHVFKQAIK